MTRTENKEKKTRPHPKWARAMIKFYLAKCWIDNFYAPCPTICGINWFNDMLLSFCVFFHNTFISPYAEDGAPFPLKLIETYSDNVEDEDVKHATKR